MAIWKCSKCNVEMEESEDIMISYGDIELPPARGYHCPSCGVDYLDGDFIEDELSSAEEMLEGK